MQLLFNPNIHHIICTYLLSRALSCSSSSRYMRKLVNIAANLTKRCLIQNVNNHRFQIYFTHHTARIDRVDIKKASSITSSFLKMLL
jgi:hypothetical protein